MTINAIAPNPVSETLIAQAAGLAKAQLEAADAVLADLYGKVAYPREQVIAVAQIIATDYSALAYHAPNA